MVVVFAPFVVGGVNFVAVEYDMHMSVECGCSLLQEFPSKQAVLWVYYLLVMGISETI